MRAILFYSGKQWKADMHATEIQEYARKMFEARGTHAIVEAAQKAIEFEKNNDIAQADDWRKIEAALKLMQGAHES